MVAVRRVCGRIGALLLSAFAVAAGAHAAPSPHPPHRPPPAAPPVAVRAIVVSGNDQEAKSYVSPGSATYEAQFAQPLVVRVEGPAVPPEHPRHVVFTCLSSGCRFGGAEQHELYDYVQRAKDKNDNDLTNAYDVRMNAGHAGAYVVIQARVPAGRYTVRAVPVANPGERAIPAWFTLTTR